MAHGPYWEDLPVDANGRRYVVPTKWNQLVANILNWQADRDAGGYALNNLGVLRFAAGGYVSGDFGVRKSTPAGVTVVDFLNSADPAIGNAMRLRLGPSSGFITAPQLMPYVEACTEIVDGQYAGLAFGTYSGGVVAERMRIDRNGRVGIGVADPKSKLHVVGLQNYADNAAAIAAGLTAGAFYHTNGALKVVI